MNELFAFGNKNDSPKYDLLKTAISHHRFVWIHPFGNGNGRTVRLFTYAILIKNGFNVNVGRIINPTAIFCSNRNGYYSHLSEAHQGAHQDILNWAEYVLKGLKEEIEKIDKLTDYSYLSREILIPALMFSVEKEVYNGNRITNTKRAIDTQVMQAGNIKECFKGKQDSETSRQI